MKTEMTVHVTDILVQKAQWRAIKGVSQRGVVMHTKIEVTLAIRFFRDMVRENIMECREDI